MGGNYSKEVNIVFFDYSEVPNKGVTFLIIFWDFSYLHGLIRNYVHVYFRISSHLHWRYSITVLTLMYIVLRTLCPMHGSAYHAHLIYVTWLVCSKNGEMSLIITGSRLPTSLLFYCLFQSLDWSNCWKLFKCYHNWFFFFYYLFHSLDWSKLFLNLTKVPSCYKALG